MQSTTQAIVGGTRDDGDAYPAVVCITEETTAGTADAITCHPLTSGFDRCVLRCRTGTLITPRFVLADRRRLIARDSRGYDQDRQQPSPNSSPEHGEGVAFGLAPVAGLIEQFATAKCWELRLSGVAPCCDHAVYPEPTDADHAVPRYLPGPAQDLACEVQADCPTEAFCCARDTDPRWASPVFARRASIACGCDEDGCDRHQICAYSLESSMAHDRETQLFHGVPGDLLHPAATVNNCIAPMAPDDAVVGDMVLLELRSNIEGVEPIPLATTELTPTFWDEHRNMSTAGYGRILDCGSAAGGHQNYRHFARGAVSVAPRTREVLLGNGESRTLTDYLVGDHEAPGAAKLDYGAPLLATIDGREQVVGIMRMPPLIGGCDHDFATHLSPDILPNILRFLDPDGDGIQRGFSDAPAPGYVDRDGDGMSEARLVAGALVATGNDNCMPPEDASPAVLARYADPTQSDRDGDGVGDVCDVCPDVWDPEQASCVSRVAVSAEDSPTGLALAVGDLVGLGCPVNNTNDPDSDEVWDVCDNCPLLEGFSVSQTQNPEQRDADGDGIGDVCDVCPGNADPALSDPVMGDLDRDGIGDMCGDNCLGVANTSQSNCNADAEIAQGLYDPITRVPTGIGDACDPVPCGETRLEAYIALARGGLTRRAGLLQAVVDTTAQPPMNDIRTGFRFCPCSAANSDDIEDRLACARDGSPGDGLCEIDDREEYDRDVPEFGESRIWRSASTSEHQDISNPTIVRFPLLNDPDEGTPVVGLRQEARVNYHGHVRGFYPVLQARWNHDDDRHRWDDLVGPTMPGVLWTHSPGQGPTAYFDLATRSLAHHYWSGVIHPEIEVGPPHPCLSYVGPWAGPGSCPLCTGSFPAPFFGLPGSRIGGGCGGPFERPVIEVPHIPVDIAEFFDDPREIFHRPDLRWLSAAEPLEWLPDNSARLIALDSTQEPIAVLGSGPNGLALLDGQGQPCTPNTCDTVPFPGALAVPLIPSAAMRVSGEPADPAECIVVLSARENALYTVAGDARTLDGSLRVRSANLIDSASDSASDSAGQVYEAELGHVLAATYRAEDRALYVLDEVERPSRHWRWPRRRANRRYDVRLVKLSPGQPGEVVASWPRHAHYTHHQLISSGSGGLWLIASKDRGRHVVVHLEQYERRHHGWRHGHRRHDRRHDHDEERVDLRWRATGFKVVRRPIADISPRSDARGLSYVVHGRSRDEVVGITEANLWPLRWRHFRQCF